MGQYGRTPLALAGLLVLLLIVELFSLFLAASLSVNTIERKCVMWM